MLDISFNGSLTYIDNIDTNLVDRIKNLVSLDIEEEEREVFISKVLLPLTTTDTGKAYIYKKNNKGIEIPTGFLPKLIKFFKKNDISYQITRLSSKVNPINLNIDSRLRDNQKKCVLTALKQKKGLIGAPTSFGKSYVIAEIINKFDDSIIQLVIVRNIDLLYQLRDDVAKYLGLDSDDIGIVGNNEIKIKPITIASRDTLTRRITNSDNTIINYLSKVNVVIFDEVHRFCNISGTVLSSFLTDTEYRLGLSATLEVDKPNLLEAIVGPLLINIPPKDCIDQGIIMKPDIRFHKVPYDLSPYEPNIKRLANYSFNKWGPMQMNIYRNLYNNLICINPHRNKLAAQLTKDFIDSNRGPILILVKSVATSGGKISHAEIFKSYLKEIDIDLPIIHGDIKRKDRQEVLDALRSKDLKGVIASADILTEGISIKSVGAVMLLLGGSVKLKQDKSYTSISLIQRIGRALRTDEDKIYDPIIYDFIDPYGVFNKQSLKRKEYIDTIYPDCSVIV